MGNVTNVLTVSNKRMSRDKVTCESEDEERN